MAELQRREAVEAQAVDAAASETEDEYEDEELVTVSADEAYGDPYLGTWARGGPDHHLPKRPCHKLTDRGPVLQSFLLYTTH